MEAARHDSLADQLLELHALEEARLAAEAEARAEAELEAKRREEAAAERRREQEEETRRRAEERARAEAQARREAEERRALQAREAQLRIKLELEAKAQEAELREELERESHAKVEEGLHAAKKRTRLAGAGAVVVLLGSAGIYGLVLGPKMERQSLEIERMRQEALVVRRDKGDLEQKVDELERKLRSMKPEQKNAAPAAAQKRPKRRLEVTRKPERDPLAKPKCDDNDPLCGI